MSDIASLLRAIRTAPGCTLHPPSGLPDLPEGVALPGDLREFYEQAGGAELFAERTCGGPVWILPPSRFERIDLAIMGETLPWGPFSWWFALAELLDGNYIAIDLNPARQGLCYDAFHETFASPGYVSVIARSFSDLLERLLAHESDSSYWLEADFEPLGEAFALYGFESTSGG